METKPGWQTTEFWITLFCQFIGILATTGVFTPEQASAVTKAIPQLGGLIVMLGSAFGYQLSRGAAKKGIRPLPSGPLERGEPSPKPDPRRDAGFARPGCLLIIMVFILALFSACGPKNIPEELTEKDTYLNARMAFNEIVSKYLIYYGDADPEKQAKWKKNVDPKIRMAESTLDAWGTALKLGKPHENDQELWLDLKDELLEVLLEISLSRDPPETTKRKELTHARKICKINWTFDGCRYILHPRSQKSERDDRRTGR